MKVVILAGGFGTRLSEYTDTIPKPMVPIGNKPIIEHIIEIYSNYGHKEFYIALGYKGEIIKSYFKNFKKDWKINLIDTGVDTFTGGRLKRLKKHIEDTLFFAGEATETDHYGTCHGAYFSGVSAAKEIISKLKP